MSSLAELHDGSFDGVWLSPNKGARFFVRTDEGERSTIILSGVEALNVTDIRQGNIILELVCIAPEKLTLNHIEDAYALDSGEVEMANRLLTKAQELGLSGLEINSSYGAVGTVLFRAIDTVGEHLLG